MDEYPARADELLCRAERIWRVEYIDGDARERAARAVAGNLRRGEAYSEPVIRSAAAGNMSVTYERPAANDAGSPESVYQTLSLYAEVYRGV